MRRAEDRFVTRGPGVVTRHGFSFGRHYDPAHVAHGRLVAHDEHRLEPGVGFGPHPHRDVEVVSWVLEGALVHEEATGAAVVPAGSLQRMCAGAGVVHDERAGQVATRFVQLWLTADPGAGTAYEQVVAGDLAEALPGIHAGRLDGAWRVPDVARVHAYVAGGACTLEGVALTAGDAVLLTGAGPVVLDGRAQVLVVELPE